MRRPPPDRVPEEVRVRDLLHVRVPVGVAEPGRGGNGRGLCPSLDDPAAGQWCTSSVGGPSLPDPGGVRGAPSPQCWSSPKLSMAEPTGRVQPATKITAATELCLFWLLKHATMQENSPVADTVGLRVLVSVQVCVRVGVHVRLSVGVRVAVYVAVKMERGVHPFQRYIRTWFKNIMRTAHSFCHNVRCVFAANRQIFREGLGQV